MPDVRPPNLPATIDRAAADRILARAVELQNVSANDPEGRLSEDQLLALAKEVGLDPVNLRQALAEEKTRAVVPDERGMIAWLGPAVASAQRTVNGTPAQILRALDDWMQRQECLAVKRQFGERIVWEAQGGLAGAMKRFISGKGVSLARATDVSATAIALDSTRVLVRLDAHLGGYRALMAKQNVGVAGATLGAGIILAALSFPALVVAAPAAVLIPAGLAMGRASQAQSVERAQLSLEQVLDRLERGEAGRPPSLVSMLAAAVGGRTNR